MRFLTAAAALIASITVAVSAQKEPTIAWPANIPALQSKVYQAPQFDLSKLPNFRWSLANESLAIRTAICSQQIDFCNRAGCDTNQGAKEAATVSENFCDARTLASKCTCSGGTSRLQQFQWPVSTNDCRFRGQACKNQCMWGTSDVANQPSCVAACDNTFGMNCGFEGQMSASYAVDKKGEMPALAMVQGGVAQSAAFSLSSSLFATTAVAAIATSLLL